MITPFFCTCAPLLALAALAGPACAEGIELLACENPHVNVGETGIRRQTHKFVIKNVSDHPVQITATHKACGCVKRDFSRYAIAPSDTTELTLAFPIRPRDPSTGDFIERLEIYLDNDHENPAQVVSVSGRLVPIAYRLRDGIHIEMPAKGGRDFRGRIDLFVNKARGVDVTSIKTMGALKMNATVAKRGPALDDQGREACAGGVGHDGVRRSIAGDWHGGGKSQQ